MKRVLIAIMLGTSAFVGTGRAESAALDPFAAPLDPSASEDRSTAADDEALKKALKEPTRFVLETHTVKATGDAAPQTVTLKLNTATGEVRRFDGKAFVHATVEGKSWAPPETAGARPANGEDAEQQVTVAKMKQIILPEVNFRQSSLEDVMAFLADASREYDPDKIGVGFATVAVDEVATVADPFAPPSDESLGPTTITFQARYVTLFDVLGIVANLADLKWGVQGGSVIWSRDWLPSDMRTRVFWLSPRLVQQIQLDPNLRVPSSRPEDDSQAVIDDRFRDFFAGIDVKWPAGSSVRFSQTMSVVSVTAYPDALVQIEDLISILNVERSTKPGQFHLLPVDAPDGARSLLLSDAVTGQIWRYRTGPEPGKASKGKSEPCFFLMPEK